VPDFAQSEKGVKFADVRENSPAGKAGLKGGDVLVEFAGKAMTSLADFTFALREHSSGETVQVTVVRAGQPLTVSVLLGSRP
jgi:S1-C subfamily serine protease